jgi:cytochrome c-type biogenesis protein CcmF
MDFLSQHYMPGAITLWCALFFALASLWGYARVLRGDKTALSFARRGYAFFALSVVLCALILLLCLARRDFRIEYVYQYSGLELPFHFQLSAFWAGQKGSFLIWLVWGALLGLPLARSAGRDEAPVMGVYLLTLFGLLFIMVRENPFVMLAETPADGAGLNPLLQDDWMVIHPPVMFIGYAAGAIPLAFAWAGMWQRDTSRWAARAFPWALGGFMVLGAAILMGGYWAYRTLGWGGYWGWDPVENASLIPWLVGVVLIHGLYLERTKKRYRRLNLVLACLLYLSVLYGTFLTRSGVLADFSVHSFVDLGISRWLVLWLGFFGLGSVYLLATRLRRVPTEPNEDPLISRGAFVMMSTLVVMLSAVLVTFGTSAPLLTRFMENPGQVGPAFYNRVHMPLALALALLLIPLPFLTWRGLPMNRLAKKLLPSAGVGLLAVAIALWQGVADVFNLLLIFLAATALASNFHKVIEMMRQAASWSKGLASSGGYLAHVGVGVMLLGILASSAYDQSAKVTLVQGEPQRVDDLTLTFNRFIPRQGREKEKMEVEVVSDKGLRYLAYPKLFVNDRTRQLMAHPHVYKALLRDLYISPIQYEAGQPLGVAHRLSLKRGDVGTAGDLEIRFVDFDLAGHDPAVQLASTGRLTVGAELEIRRGGEAVKVKPEYILAQGGAIETPPVPLPGGGAIAMTGISPATGAIRLDIAGVDAEPEPAKLSVDVTRKPLIKMVWYGLYIVLAGGCLAGWKRFQAARMVDEIEAKKARKSGGG